MYLVFALLYSLVIGLCVPDVLVSVDRTWLGDRGTNLLRLDGRTGADWTAWIRVEGGPPGARQIGELDP